MELNSLELFTRPQNFNTFLNKLLSYLTCLQWKPFENTEGKGEIAHDEQFLLFPQYFLTIWRTFCYFHQIQNCFLQTLWVWKSLKSVVWEVVKLVQFKDTCIWKNEFVFNPFPNKPWFLHVCSSSLLKTLWENEKLLITSNFSFSPLCAYKELSAIFIPFKIVICKLFEFGRVENLSFGKGLNWFSLRTHACYKWICL